MKRSLRFQLSLSNAVVVLLTVCVISLTANVLIQRQLDRYIMNRQTAHAEHLADSIAAQYGANGDGWNLDYIHGFGMYALNDGYIIKVCRTDGETVWDAENHDMAMCHGVMERIMARLTEERLSARVELVTRRFELATDSGTPVGYADISYYTPNYAGDDDFNFLRALNRILLATGLVALAAAVVVGALMARHIARPISAATELTREISGGNYDIRLEETTKSLELSTLTGAVNQMAEDLQAQETRKRRLTTDVAHELRTPLANMGSYLEMMAEGVWEPTPERLGACLEETRRIADIVSQLETLHRTEAAKDEIKPKAVELLALCEGVRDSFSGQLTARRQACEVTGERVELTADRGKLQQIVTNLLSNASKYSPEGSPIAISVGRRGDMGFIAVEDHGIGIPADEQALVFERFYRTDLSRSRKTGGAGIGLAIARALAEAHGGHIDLESTEDRGSRFTVWIPIKRS